MSSRAILYSVEIQSFSHSLFTWVRSWQAVLFLNGWEANNGFSIFKGWQTHKTTQKNDCRARKAKILHLALRIGSMRALDSHTLGEWLRLTPGISLCLLFLGTTAVTGSPPLAPVKVLILLLLPVWGLRSPSWLRFSSGCLLPLYLFFSWLWFQNHRTFHLSEFPK